MQMTQESIDAFLNNQKEKGVSKDSLRQRKGFLAYLFRWLPDDKALTKERLDTWREDMRRRGYTKQTVLNYVKGINLYLDYMGWSDIRFNRGRPKDIRNLTFGYLKPIEPTCGRDKRYVVWRCKCKCGSIVELPATRLLSGNTLSCGCMKTDIIRAASKNIAGTQLVKALKDDKKKTNTLSGYTGVSPKRDKWCAHITYRGKRYHLGTYSNIEDAVRARARAKELVMEDARQLLDVYEGSQNNSSKAGHEALLSVNIATVRNQQEKASFPEEVRSNNSSGCTGVSRSHKKWKAYISYKGKRYTLGHFAEKSQAIAARKMAEKQLLEDPESFAASRIPG